MTWLIFLYIVLSLKVEIGLSNSVNEGDFCSNPEIKWKSFIKFELNYGSKFQSKCLIDFDSDCALDVVICAATIFGLEIKSKYLMQPLMEKLHES